ncbi:MAG: ACP S-malonyltransferase [Erysipelotrichaceae bacterium]
MKIAFLFAGQGSQHVGMGADFYDHFAASRNVYDTMQSDFDVKALCFEGPQDQLNQTRYAQPSICVTSLAIAAALEEQGIVPQGVAGLSLGEYSALAYAKGIAKQDLIPIVTKRGFLMQEALENKNTSMIALLNLDKQAAQLLCQQVQSVGVCEIANYNSPAQIVISGDRAALEEAAALAMEQKGVRAIPLQVSGAFHSSFLNEAAMRFKATLEQFELSQPRIPVYHNVSAKVSDRPLIDLLTTQMHSSVRFCESVEQMIADGFDTFIEIGPGNAISGFVKKINSDVRVATVKDLKSFEKVYELVKEKPWNEK